MSFLITHARKFRRHQGLSQWIGLDVAEVDFGAFGLKKDFAAGGKGVDSFVGQLAVHVLPNVPIAVHKFDDIPLPVWFFQFIDRVTKTSHVFEFAFVNAVYLRRFSVRSRDAYTGLSVWANRSQRGAIGHPEVAGATFVDLKLDGTRPHL